MNTKEMSIDSVRVSTMNYQRVVILKETMAERYLPIWIGPAEADAIAVQLQDVSVSRPQTHDLMQSIISTLGAQINHIIVNDIRNDTFYAKIYLKVNGSELEIDSRPCDAIALAVRTNAPIYVEDSILEKAGIYLDTKTGKPVTKEQEGESREPKGHISQEDVKRMSAFHDFISTLDLEDLGEHDS
ncbi:bifunctional nuclease family protein [Chloroflexota bacterium]